MTQAELAEKYHIVSYGDHGFEVQLPGRKPQKFNAHQDFRRNWEEALAWAQMRLAEPKDFTDR